MKQILFFILLNIAGTIAFSQQKPASRTANYEAAGWTLWHLDRPQEITIASTPDDGATKDELKKIKACMQTLDEKKLADIKYWDAGAPSYRWNRLGNKVIPWENVDVVLRMPMSWMNLAVYNATVLAWKEKLKYKRARPASMDPSIQPLVAAPLTYSYPCEHAVTSAAAAYVLAYFVPAKADSIIALAKAAAQSRVDAGVQYPSDMEAGWKLGEQVARQIIEKAKNDGATKTYNGAINKDPKKWTGNYAMGIKDDDKCDVNEKQTWVYK